MSHLQNSSVSLYFANFFWFEEAVLLLRMYVKIDVIVAKFKLLVKLIHELTFPCRQLALSDEIIPTI